MRFPVEIRPGSMPRSDSADSGIPDHVPDSDSPHPGDIDLPEGCRAGLVRGTQIPHSQADTCAAGYRDDVSFGLVFLIILLGLLYLVALFWYSFRRATRTLPRVIIRQLSEPGSHFDVAVRTTGGTWNPGKPLGPGNRIPGRGQASYRLDEVGIVHLVFRSKTGHEEQFSGAIPADLRTDSEVALRSRRVRRWVYVLYPAFLLAGYAVAASVAEGPTFKRLDLGFVGIFVAMVAAQVILLILGVVSAGRSLTKRSNDAQMIASERETPDR